jgi:hypothetical protein
MTGTISALHFNERGSSRSLSRADLNVVVQSLHRHGRTVSAAWGVDSGTARMCPRADPGISSMVSMTPLAGTLFPWQIAESIKWSNRLGREPVLEGGSIFCGTNWSRFSFRLNGLAALSFLE